MPQATVKHGQGEVHVGVQRRVAGGGGHDVAGRGEGGRGLRASPPGGRTGHARVGPRRGRAGGRARDAAARAQLVRDHGRRAAPFEHVEEHPVREPAGGAVQRAFEDAEPGRDGRVRVRAGGRGDAYGEGRGGQVVVDEQAECRVQGAQ